MSAQYLDIWAAIGSLNGASRQRAKYVAIWGTVFVGAFVMAGLLGSSPAFAQGGVINLDETVIKGRIQKPEAFYILQHAKLNYQNLQPKPTFLPELLETVEEEPF